MIDKEVDLPGVDLSVEYSGSGIVTTHDVDNVETMFSAPEMDALFIWWEEYRDRVWSCWKKTVWQTREVISQSIP